MDTENSMEKLVGFNLFLQENLASAKSFAENNQKCLRKAVGCALVGTIPEWRLMKQFHNGPSGRSSVCSNIVGNCGCSHAEPRAMLWAAWQIFPGDESPLLLSTYAPCTNCANIILDWGHVRGLVYEHETNHDQRGLQYLKAKMPCVSLADLQVHEKFYTGRIAEGCVGYLAYLSTAEGVRDQLSSWL